MALTFGHVEIEDCVVKVGGAVVQAAELAGMSVPAGGSLLLDVLVPNGPHNVQLSAEGPSGGFLSLDGGAKEAVESPCDLHFSKMAVCIGMSCLPWPKPKPPAWKLESLAIEGLTVRHNGKEISVDQVKELCAKSKLVELDLGDHSLVLQDAGSGRVTVKMNGDGDTVMSPIELHVDENAVCFGDVCKPWPPPLKREKRDHPEPAAAAPQGPNDEQFLAEVKTKLGEAEWNRLSALLKQVSSGHENGHGHGGGHVDHGPVKVVHSKAEFQAALAAAGDRGVVVDFNAAWCVPCKKMLPELIKFAEGPHKDHVYLSVDVNEVPALKNSFGVDALPTFVFLRGAAEAVPRLTGSSVSDLEARLAALKDAAPAAAAAAPRSVMPERSEFDLIVIGGGSGGMALAKQAAALGAHVGILDFVKPTPQGTTWGLGGTCVNVGCVPKKLMHYAGLCGEQLHDAKTFGWSVTANGFDWHKLVRTVQDHVTKLNFFYEKGLSSANTITRRGGETVKISDGTVTYFNALGRFESTKVVVARAEDGEEKRITSDKIVIAPGGRPFIPADVPGAREYSITSDDIFSLKKAPGKTLVVGAGYIALECAGFLTALGFEVQLAVRSEPLRGRGFDRQAVAKVAELMEKLGTKFLRKTTIKSIAKEGEKLRVTLLVDGQEKQEVFDTVLYATGRAADAEGLNLQAAGVEVLSDGKIRIDDAEATNVPGIFALGDVVENSPELTPTAIQSAELLAKRLFAGKTEKMDWDLVPTAVFTPFEYGRVGMSEEDAVAKYGADDVEVYLQEFQTLELGAAHRHVAPSAQSPDAEEAEELPTNALSKLICLKSQNLKVIGFHFVGPNAGELTQGFALALRLGATKKDFDDVVGIHPTDAESFTVLKVSKRSGEEWESKGGCGGGKCG